MLQPLWKTVCRFLKKLKIVSDSWSRQGPWDLGRTPAVQNSSGDPRGRFFPPMVCNRCNQLDGLLDDTAGGAETHVGNLWFELSWGKKMFCAELDGLILRQNITYVEI